MTHPHRISTQTNWDLAKGAMLGLLDACVKSAVIGLVLWWFFGHLIPEERPVPTKTIEAGIKI